MTKTVIEVRKDMMLFNWKKPVTLVLLDDNTYATTEYPTDVRVGDTVVIMKPTKRGTLTFKKGE